MSVNWRALILICAGMMIASCSGPATTKNRMATDADTTVSGDFGDDWSAAADDRSRGTGSGARGGNRGAADAAFAGRSSYWSVLLQSFPANSPGHRARAIELIRRMSQVDPALAESFIHTNDRGSLVLFGRHTSVEDPGAQEDLSFVQGVLIREQPLFPRAMLTRIRQKVDASTLGPNELLSLRVSMPQFRDLYTFQIAVWGTFREYAERGERVMSWDEVQAAAERNVRDLRARGYQAYYHHDEGKELSMVTIGVYDRTAYDAQSGLYLDPRLERMSKEFSEHLMNGEPVVMQQGKLTVPQRPLLVLVPELP